MATEEDKVLLGESEDENIPARLAAKNLNADTPSAKQPLNAKDYHAWWITLGCIGALVVIWLVEFFGTQHGNSSEHTETVIDILRYAITASLSFFFGTKAANKDE